MNKIFDGILLVSDIDGTFLDEKKQLLKKNLDAVEYFKANGGMFTFATGRYEKGEQIQEMKNYVNAPAICTNGACIYDFSIERVIHKQCLDGREIIETLYKIKEKYSNINVITIRYTYEDDIVFINNNNKEEILTYDWYKIVIIGDGDILDEIREYLTDIYGDKYAYSKSESTLFEILDKDATKGTMIQYLHKYLNEKYNRKLKLYAIGDYENDIPMLRYADFAACPDNALDIVKAECDLVVCNQDDGSVADLIYKIEEEIRHG